MVNRDVQKICLFFFPTSWGKGIKVSIYDYNRYVSL